MDGPAVQPLLSPATTDLPQAAEPLQAPEPPQLAESEESQSLRNMWPWYVWLVSFYLVWAILNFGLGYFEHTIEHYPIAIAMALGSYVAGATPMGGGTVGFPILVLFFDAPASLGRNFGLVIQSIGMTSASIFILCRRSPIEPRLLKYGILGTAAGLIFGTFWVVPFVEDDTVKLVFACLWCTFGVMTLAKNREFCEYDRIPSVSEETARRIGLIVGLCGGITTALTGVGVDMMVYAVLVLLFRADLKVAVPTSVIIMAAGSLMGTALHLWMGDINQEVFHNWLAAAPIVILGAPLGAMLVSIISRQKTLYFVAVLCLLQFVWTLQRVGSGPGKWGFIAVNLALSGLGFVWLYRIGQGPKAQSSPA